MFNRFHVVLVIHQFPTHLTIAYINTPIIISTIIAITQKHRLFRNQWLVRVVCEIVSFGAAPNNHTSQLILIIPWQAWGRLILLHIPDYFLGLVTV